MTGCLPSRYTESATVDVSVILPVYNAENWIDDCLDSVLKQSYNGTMELSIYDDGSTDTTTSIIDRWMYRLSAKMLVVRSGHKMTTPKGVGFAKNRAVHQSHGRYICFLDADDIMMPLRIQKQWEAAQTRPSTIIGCQFERIPSTATPRYTSWANQLTPQQLQTQAYLSHGPTVIMPTWFCSAEVYYKAGGFVEMEKGTPEDLIFFYKHLDLGGQIYRVDSCLLLYRYHPCATTLSVSEETIWELRIRRLEEKVLSNWHTFTVWNAGKQGRKFYRSLRQEYREKVVALCDVDPKKILHGIYVFESSKENPKPSVPIIHYSNAKAPFVICMKLGLTKGQFEENLRSLKLEEGQDFYHFN